MQCTYYVCRCGKKIHELRSFFIFGQKKATFSHGISNYNLVVVIIFFCTGVLRNDFYQGGANKKEKEILCISILSIGKLLTSYLHQINVGIYFSKYYQQGWSLTYLDGKPMKNQKRTFRYFHEWSLKIGQVLAIPINNNVINLMELSNLLFYFISFWTKWWYHWNKKIKEKRVRLVCIFQFCIWIEFRLLLLSYLQSCIGSTPN